MNFPEIRFNLLTEPDSVIIVSCVISLVEFFKQFAKSKFTKKHGISHLENWEIRGITILLGCLFTFGIMSVNYKLRLVYDGLNEFE